jgi:hypothetical protein
MKPQEIEYRCRGAFGPAHSSEEGPVMGVERRGRVVRDCVYSINRAIAREESREQVEISGQAV